MEPYGICSAAEKQQIKQMLRDAICVMCKNTVTHHVQLSIEALIGITIDNGEEILLVSIKELFNKPNSSISKAPTSTASSSSYSSSSEATTGVLYHGQMMSSEQMERVTIDDDSEDIPSIPEKPSINTPNQLTNIKSNLKPEAVTSVGLEFGTKELEKCVKQYSEDHISPSSPREFQDQSTTALSNEVLNDGVLSKKRRRNSLSQSWISPPDQFDSSQLQHSPMNDAGDSILSSDADIPPQDESLQEDNELFYKALSMATDESTKERTRMTPKHKQDRPTGPKLFNIDSRLLPQRRAPRRRFPLPCSSGCSEKPTSDITNGDIPFAMMYTCTLCGAQMGRLDSFKRHKRSHQVTVFAPCDICGKLFSRRDNMLSHRRRCMSML